MYVYIKSEPNLWTVGFYNPQGNWISESDYDTPEEAAGRVNWLNGGHKKQDDIFDMSREEIEQYVEKQLKELNPDLKLAFYYYLKYLSL